jgi:hypothetical protein
LIARLNIPVPVGNGDDYGDIDYADYGDSLLITRSAFAASREQKLSYSPRSMFQYGSWNSTKPHHNRLPLSPPPARLPIKGLL